MPERTFALILALQRNIVAYREDVLAGEWQRSGQFCFFNHAIHDLAGARLDIVGDGVFAAGWWTRRRSCRRSTKA